MKTLQLLTLGLLVTLASCGSDDNENVTQGTFANGLQGAMAQYINPYPLQQLTFGGQQVTELVHASQGYTVYLYLFAQNQLNNQNNFPGPSTIASQGQGEYCIINADFDGSVAVGSFSYQENSLSVDRLGSATPQGSSLQFNNPNGNFSFQRIIGNASRAQICLNGSNS